MCRNGNVLDWNWIPIFCPSAKQTQSRARKLHAGSTVEPLARINDELQSLGWSTIIEGQNRVAAFVRTHFPHDQGRPTFRPIPRRDSGIQIIELKALHELLGRFFRGSKNDKVRSS